MPDKEEVAQKKNSPFLHGLAGLAYHFRQTLNPFYN